MRDLDNLIDGQHRESEMDEIEFAALAGWVERTRKWGAEGEKVGGKSEMRETKRVESGSGDKQT